MNILGISPDIIFRPLITNKDLLHQMDLASKISNLPKERVLFLLNIANLLDDLK